MSLFRLIAICLVLAGMVTCCDVVAEELPRIVILYQNPRVMHESFRENWPHNLKGFGIQHMHYSNATMPGSKKRSNTIKFRFSRGYLVGLKQKRTIIDFNGTLLDPIVGESFILLNSAVKVREIEAGEGARAKLEILNDEEIEKTLKRAGNGFFLCEGAGIGNYDKQFFMCAEVLPLEDDPAKFTIKFDHCYGFADDEMRTPLTVGDVIEMGYCTLKITDAAAADKKANTRGWIVLEPVLAEPVTLAD